MRKGLCLLLLIAACDGRGRPITGTDDPEYEAVLLAPISNSVLPTSAPISVRVAASDHAASVLKGAGFIARRSAPGEPVVDSATTTFPARSDSTHEFTMVLADSFPTGTRLDLYGVAVGANGQRILSPVVHVTVAQCINDVCR